MDQEKSLQPEIMEILERQELEDISYFCKWV